MGNLLILTGLAGIALLVLPSVWTLIKKLWPAAGTSTIGTAITAGTDLEQKWVSYASLTVIHDMDSVQADPKAVEACDYLRLIITAWKRPTDAVDPTVPANMVKATLPDGTFVYIPKPTEAAG